MKREEFLNELLDNTKKEYEYFCKFQDKVLHLLDVTHKILHDYSIEYYVMFGSLVGVCRDEGIVPWDYDFDIIISIEDAFKVTKLLEENLPDDCYVISNFNDTRYPYFQTRVCQKGYPHSLHVDIFYFFGAPDEGSKIETTKKEIGRLYSIRCDRYVEFGHKEMTGLKRVAYMLAWILRKIQSGYLFKSHIDKKINSMVLKYPVCKSNRIIVLTEHPYCYDKKMLGKPKLCSFSGHDAYIPENASKVLGIQFTNYLEPPSFNTRYREYLQGLNMLKKLGDNIWQFSSEVYRLP